MTGRISFVLRRLSHKPYFGIYMNSLLGDPRRHFYLQSVIEELCKKKNAESIQILEVGSWAGGSAITIGKAINLYNQGRGFLICVDCWEPFLSGKDIAKDSFYKVWDQSARRKTILNLFLHNIHSTGISDVVIPIKSFSKDILPLLKSDFDMVFVDGSHYYKDVVQDLSMSMALIKEGGIICGDDLELQFRECDQQVVYEKPDEEYLQDPRTSRFFHPGVTCAVGELFGEVSVWEGFWAMKKTNKGWEKVVMNVSKDDVVVPEHLRKERILR